MSARGGCRTPEHMERMRVLSAAVRWKPGKRHQRSAAARRRCIVQPYLPCEMIGELRAEARRTGRTISGLVRSAWRIARRQGWREELSR